MPLNAKSINGLSVLSAIFRCFEEYTVVDLIVIICSCSFLVKSSAAARFLGSQQRYKTSKIGMLQRITSLLCWYDVPLMQWIRMTEMLRS